MHIDGMADADLLSSWWPSNLPLACWLGAAIVRETSSLNRLQVIMGYDTNLHKKTTTQVERILSLESSWQISEHMS
jgi:hypothetical protein